MQKIGFNQRYGLQQAVFDGTKTMTRRIEKPLDNAVKNYRNSYSDRPAFNIISQRYSERGGIEIQLERDFIFIPTRYKLNEIVAVAQSYETLANCGHLDEMLETSSTFKKEYCGAGWNNKMFVHADLMPHQIQITGIRIEQLQDISDEDCLNEGVECYLDIISEKGASKYEKHAEEEYWIAGGDSENHYDQSISYCRNCAEKIAKKENKEKGYGEWDNYYHRDGGWGQEHDRSSLSCEECGKPLLFDYIPTFFDDDIEELCLDDVSDLYLLNQMLHDCNDEIREKAIQRLLRPAFAALIERPGVVRKGLWAENPHVVAYTFKLVK